jgi:hypothetical protein
VVARDDQDLALVVKRSTGSNARVDQDVALVVKRPTGSRARVNQSIAFVVCRTHLAVRVNQDVVLLVGSRGAAIFQPNVCVCT